MFVWNLEIPGNYNICVDRKYYNLVYNNLVTFDSYKSIQIMNFFKRYKILVLKYVKFAICLSFFNSYTNYVLQSLKYFSNLLTYMFLLKG